MWFNYKNVCVNEMWLKLIRTCISNANIYTTQCIHQQWSIRKLLQIFSNEFHWPRDGQILIDFSINMRIEVHVFRFHWERKCHGPRVNLRMAFIFQWKQKKSTNVLKSLMSDFFILGAHSFCSSNCTYMPYMGLLYRLIKFNVNTLKNRLMNGELFRVIKWINK